MIDLRQLSVDQRVAWAFEHLPSQYVLTSSFGAQSAVCLHLLTQHQRDLPVVLIDTGYLFPETYQFIDELTARLKLNLKVYKSELSPAWLESRYGKLWRKDLAGIEQYNQITKVKPLERAFKELKVKTWFSGLRNSQAASRAHTPMVEQKGDITKFHPIIDFTDRDVYQYLKKHQLPYHPLWEKGYVSIGDVHTTRPLSAVNDVTQTRFHGLKRECGIHEINF
ncbi:phosphoadenylyl-sulfate reductase [Marinicella sp. S1101]|uniref:phosphoadenylyl-sulfate reductase n=1 Tax=Marinicella marina TaxID=2996016 RepID=UPI0022608A01|nr:phosphoadenylyl-sulfate reductase [Marinicella marina]MCX7552698.1 phosphoadenylyl-sulfate reductase [Marinicella marina]MDJ1139993.1 phosphoadenylyl-sulfate reductase [Marinicella marina]